MAGASPTGFHRTPNPTVLFANTLRNMDITKQSFGEAFSVLAHEANISQDKFQIKGSALGSKFEIQFLGEYQTGRRYATQFLLSLRLGGGEYKKQEASTPDDGKVQFFVNPDKNGAQVRMEIQAKALRDILGEVCLGKQFFLRRSEGTIFVDRRPLVAVQVQSQDESRL